MAMRCSGCGERFKSLTAFDTHRVGAFATRGRGRGNRRCLTRAEMPREGLTYDEKRGWKREGVSPYALAKTAA